MDPRSWLRVLRPALLALLWLPLSVQWGLPLREKPLAGAFVKVPRPTLSWTSWFDGSFGADYAAWHNQNFGLRSTVVRIYNQEGRSFFGVARANNIEIGAHDVLYDKESILASRGDPVSPRALEDLANQIANVNQALAARGVTLVVGIAPGKATYWPDDVPRQFGPPTRDTAGSMLAKALVSRGDFTINWIDLFRERATTDPWPLFPKTGMHWSRYGAARAIDDLVTHIESRRAADLPGLKWGVTRPARKPDIPDDDVGSAMNLLFPISPGLLAHPEVTIEPGNGRVRPSMLVIGDSFFWTMLAFPISPGIFSRIDYRFYNRERHRFGEAANVPEDPVDAALQHDIVLLIGSDSVGLRLGWGFVQAASERWSLSKPPADGEGRKGRD